MSMDIVSDYKAGLRDFRYANLRGADLTGASLIDADLSGANLTNANLIDADLSGANLTNADLTGANLVDANLAGANLRGADLDGADLDGADLNGADLNGARVSYDVPVVVDLHRKVRDAIGPDGELLDMHRWHTCGTVHCRAGWAVELAGESGRDLEGRIGPGAAGGLIYWASTGSIPDFYADQECALESIRDAARGAGE